MDQVDQVDQVDQMDQVDQVGQVDQVDEVDLLGLPRPQPDFQDHLFLAILPQLNGMEDVREARSKKQVPPSSPGIKAVFLVFQTKLSSQYELENLNMNFIPGGECEGRGEEEETQQQ